MAKTTCSKVPRNSSEARCFLKSAATGAVGLPNAPHPQAPSTRLACLAPPAPKDVPSPAVDPSPPDTSGVEVTGEVSRDERERRKRKRAIDVDAFEVKVEVEVKPEPL